jgi:hypothetical protein
VDAALATWLAGSPVLLAAAVVWLVFEVRRQTKKLDAITYRLLERRILEPGDLN